MGCGEGMVLLLRTSNAHLSCTAQQRHTATTACTARTARTSCSAQTPCDPPASAAPQSAPGDSKGRVTQGRWVRAAAQAHRAYPAATTVERRAQRFHQPAKPESPRLPVKLLWQQFGGVTAHTAAPTAPTAAPTAPTAAPTCRSICSRHATSCCSVCLLCARAVVSTSSVADVLQGREDRKAGHA